jgi:hypothetical protein
MEDIRAYEAARRPDTVWSERFLSTRVARYAMSAGGALLGLINIMRVYSAIFSAAACR